MKTASHTARSHALPTPLSPGWRMPRRPSRCGLTLVELLLAVAVLGILSVGLSQVLKVTLASGDRITTQQRLLTDAAFAMDRIALFVEAADAFTVSGRVLIVTERLLDTYSNATHTVDADGDGFLDADNDSDQLVDAGSNDPPEFVTFQLNTSTPRNGVLLETDPNYGTAETTDTTPATAICEHVTNFSCRLLGPQVVEISLGLSDGAVAVNLQRRVAARSFLASRHLSEAPQVTMGSIATGTYPGNGAATHAIAGIGFNPAIVIVKANDSVIAVIRTGTMAGNASKPMVGNTPLTANLIKSLDTTGFTVGSDNRVNRSNKYYYWTAFREVPGETRIGSYVGDHTPDRVISGIGFDPDLVFVIATEGEAMVLGTPTAAGALDFNNGNPISSGILTPWPAGGFRIGDDNKVNRAGKIYHYVCWRDVAGQHNFGSYAGNGIDSRNITGLGFQPDYVMVRCITDGEFAVHRNARIGTTDSTMYFKASANGADMIQSFLADGFQVGKQPSVNKSGQTYAYFAWKDQ